MHAKNGHNHQALALNMFMKVYDKLHRKIERNLTDMQLIG